MSYNDFRSIYDCPGIQLEGDMIQAFMNVYNTEKVQKIYRATEYADKKEGTDFFFMLNRNATNNIEKYMRVDTTANFSEKDQMPHVYETDMELADGYPLKIGIRLGNCHGPFPEPVVVIGTDMPAHEYRQCENIINAKLDNEQFMMDLTDKMMDAYEDYTSLDREDINDVLRPNPYSNTQKRILKHYEPYEKIQNDKQKTLTDILKPNNIRFAVKNDDQQNTGIITPSSSKNITSKDKKQINEKIKETEKTETNKKAKNSYKEK